MAPMGPTAPVFTLLPPELLSIVFEYTTALGAAEDEDRVFDFESDDESDSAHSSSASSEAGSDDAASSGGWGSRPRSVASAEEQDALSNGGSESDWRTLEELMMLDAI